MGVQFYNFAPDDSHQVQLTYYSSPFVERFVRSIKSECLDRMIILGEAHLRYCIEQYIAHYHTERAHQSLDNTLIEPPPQGTGKIIRQERLGGLLKFYRRAA